MATTAVAPVSTPSNTPLYVGAACMFYLMWRKRRRNDEAEKVVPLATYMFAALIVFSYKANILEIARYVGPIVLSNFALKNGWSHEAASLTALLTFVGTL